MSSREFIHPIEQRPLTLRECARLQSFPDRYQFVGNDASIAKQIGNAVPPLAAELLARSIVESTSSLKTGGTHRRLVYSLSDSSGRSPALRETERLLSTLSGFELPVQTSLLRERSSTVPRLKPDQSRRITSARDAGPIALSDRELARLFSLLLTDINRKELIPEWVPIPQDYSDYYSVPPAWFSEDPPTRPFDLPGFYLKLSAELPDFETLFECITQIHRRRRKYDAILKAQPFPTMDQVARKGLLEFGLFPSPALTSWLVWRKWLFDLDNRSAQETGYLFEPIFSASLGGTPKPGKSSPIKRLDREGGRQVDCLIDDGERRLAYEFKARVTIASSGQGRWREELSFPAEATAAGFKPVLLVLDPTKNEKLDELVRAFHRSGGDAHIGEHAWRHILDQASPVMQRFIELYVRRPLQAIIADGDLPLAPIAMQYDAERRQVSFMVGDQSFVIDRNVTEQLAAAVADESADDESSNTL